MEPPPAPKLAVSTPGPSENPPSSPGGFTPVSPNYQTPISPLRFSNLHRSATRKPTVEAAPTPKTALTTESSSSSVDPIQLSRAPGAEPGIDPRKESAIRAYGNIHEDCEIEVIDYSSEHIKFNQFHNKSFLDFLDSKEGVRQPGMKVRWINIAGISWDIMSALALRYQLHPLAVEDVFHSGPNSRSKADYYRSHLFLHVLCNAVSSKKSSPLHPKYLKEDCPVSSDDSSVEEDEGEDHEPTEDEGNILRRRVTRRRRQRQQPIVPAIKPVAALRWMESTMLLSPEARKRAERLAKLNALKKRDRVRVIVSNAFLFLFKDGTVISIHSSDRAFGNPIYQRLRHPDMVLRKDPDASLLIHAIVDLVVDQGLMVVDKYADKIAELETNILLKPNMDIVRGLHILSADLTTRKRNVEPMKRLIYGLRRFDLERTAAAMAPSTTVVTEGYMSPKAKVYFADVSDHLETIQSSLDQYSTMIDNLIDFAFNMSANATNMVMARMTYIMAVFLPLTVLTGYFGMNFVPERIVNKHSDTVFWIIALPVMAVILPLAFWNDIAKLFRYIGRLRIIGHVERKHSNKVRRAKQQHRAMSAEKEE